MKTYNLLNPDLSCESDIEPLSSLWVIIPAIAWVIMMALVFYGF